MHGGSINLLHITNDGLLVTGAADASVKIFDIGNPNPVAVEKVTHAELTITQADDFILLASGVIENAVAYDPRLIPVTTEEPNTLKYSFKARYEISKKNENRTITTAITLGSKKLENIDKILIESKNTIFELKL